LCIQVVIAQGTLPWQPTKVEKSAFFAVKIFFVALPFRSGLEYRNGNGQLRSALNVATLSTTLVKFSAVTPEKHLLIFVLF